MKSQIIYECEVCGNKSASKEDIETCEATPIYGPEGFEVGDIVYCGNGYHWWGQDKSWFHEDIGDKNSTNHHVNGRIGYAKYIIVGEAMYSDVSALSFKSHEKVFLLFSPSHANSESIYAWTGLNHMKMHFLEKKPELVEGFKELINKNKMNPHLL